MNKTMDHCITQGMVCQQLPLRAVKKILRIFREFVKQAIGPNIFNKSSVDIHVSKQNKYLVASES